MFVKRSKNDLIKHQLEKFMLYWQKLDHKKKTENNLAVGLSLYSEILKDRKSFYRFEKTKHLFDA